MQVLEKTIPWWRKALKFALGGIRSGFGFFPWLARLEPVAVPVFSGEHKEIPEEERALTKAFPKIEIAASAIPAERETTPKPVAKTKRLSEPAIAASSELATEHEEGAGKSEVRIEFSEETPAEAKAHVDSSASAARLKSCPDTPPVISAAREAEATGEAERTRDAEPPSAAALETVAATETEQTPVPAAKPEAVNESNAEQVVDGAPIKEVVEARVEETEPVVEVEAAPKPVEEVELVVEPEITDTPVAAYVASSEQIEEPEPVVESEPEAEASTAPVPDSAIDEAVPVAEKEAAPLPEPISACEPAVEISPEMEPASITASEPVAEQQSAPEPVVEQAQAADAGAQLVLTAESSAEEKADTKADEKAAAKLAARQKKLDESSEQSPFSVFVGQVYDGPLDLLLDLIRKQDIDIYDIPIARITAQFLAYVNQLRAGDVDVAGEFIYTASLLIHIKSKMLLPRAATGPEDVAEDPRRELVERLLEHERFKNAAQMLQQKQMLEAATWSNPGVREFKGDEGAEPEIAADTVDLVRIFRDILERARNRPVLNVEEDSVTVGQMIQFLARRLTMEDKPVALRRLLSHTRSERALIAMFLALLEMVRLQAILLRQDRQFSEIFIKKHSGFDAVMNEGLGNARDDWR